MRPHLFIGHVQHFSTHALGVTLVLTCVLGGYLCGLKPWLDSEQLLRQTSLDNQQLHSNAPAIEARIQKITSDIETKRAELAQLHSIPTDPHQPLIELVSQLLSQHALTLSSLREDTAGPSGSTTLSLQVSGRYVDLLELLSELRQLERPARVLALTLTPTDFTGAACSAKLSVGFASVSDGPHPGDGEA